MNLLGHTHVALAGGRDDAEWLLGAVLPDLAPMAGVRLPRTGLTGALGDGVRCHLRADAAFHAHARFRAGSRELLRDLSARGIARGAARAVAHAGWEMLLDGTLVGAEAEAAFRRAVADAGRRAADLMAPADAARWLAFVSRTGDRRSSGRSGADGGASAADDGGGGSDAERSEDGGGRGVRLRYDDPWWVADRLHAMLAERPRLALPAGDVPTVAEVLASHAAGVQGAAAVVLADTAAAVHAA